MQTSWGKQETIKPMQEMTLFEGNEVLPIFLFLLQFLSKLISGFQSIWSFTTITESGGLFQSPTLENVSARMANKPFSVVDIFMPCFTSLQSSTNQELG